MKKIMTVLMFLAISLSVCSGFIVAPAMAVEGVVTCRDDADCDNGLGLYCTSQPLCHNGECEFVDPCQKYDGLFCNQLSQFNDNRACVECIDDRPCEELLEDRCDDTQNHDMCDSDFYGACVGNKCTECITDDDCKGNSVCKNGLCNECTIDKECKAYQFCDDGHCAAVTNPTCTSDSQCPVRGVGFCQRIPDCVAGVCDNESNACTQIGEVCSQDGTRCAYCVEDADCADWCLNNEDGKKTGPYCDGEAYCSECADAADCTATFCNGTAKCTSGECGFTVPNYEPCTTAELLAGKNICDETGKRCVKDCLEDSDCPNAANYCNGTGVCNADGSCGFTGKPAECANQCLPQTQECYDCENDAQCGGVKFPGKPYCNIDDPDTNRCVECKIDSQCAAGEFCLVENYIGRCVECNSDTKCTEAEPRCRLPQYQPHLDCEPAPYDTNVCVECFDDSDCRHIDENSAKRHCLVEDCPERIQEGPCEPEEDHGIGTVVNKCVECEDDSDCEPRYDDDFAPCKLNGVCSVDNTCTYTNPCGNMECYPAGYYELAEIQAPPRPDDNIKYFCADCANDAACDDGIYCNGAETCTKGDCGPGVAPCDSSKKELCVEATEICQPVDCLTDADCDGPFDICTANVCVETPITCGLVISPKKLSLKSALNPKGKIFKIKGVKNESGFDPMAERDFGVFRALTDGTVKKGKLSVPLVFGNVESAVPGTVQFRIGNCAGEITLK